MTQATRHRTTLDPGAKPERVYTWLQQRISTGEWGRGERIPNRSALIGACGGSVATLQKALGLMKQEGYVVARGRSGTFVAERLPNEYRIGLATGMGRREEQPYSRMWQALEWAVGRINQESAYRITHYHPMNNPESCDWPCLLQDVRHNCLAGLFIVGMSVTPFQREGLLAWPGLRLLALSGDARRYGLPTVEMAHYFKRAVDFFAGQGRSRIGLVRSTLMPPDTAAWQRLLAERQLSFDPYRMVVAGPRETAAIRVAVYHMMKQSAEHRPDALLVTDDHMVQPVTEALRDASVSTPEDVLVVGHCNYPLPPPHCLPVTFVGFDLEEMVRDAVVHLVSRDASATSHRVYQARFDFELPEGYRAAGRMATASLNQGAPSTAEAPPDAAADNPLYTFSTGVRV